jgi:DNA repair exonuclease SbcCD ATPase subunit
MIWKNKSQIWKKENKTMSRITLNNLKIEMFKGIQSFILNLDGSNAVVIAENGVGKTTIYDSFLWLLFGKDSTGRKEFEVRPLDRRNHPIKGVVVASEAEIGIDGVNHVFRKEHHEKVVKKQLRGYETLCWIDEVPMKVGEYAEYIAKIISEEHFKLLTDLHFFNSKMKWTERRKVLLEIAGEIEQPEGFDDLIAAMNGRPIDKYKTVLSEQKKRYVKERDEINPRIDEILKGLEHPTEDTTELALRRDKFKDAIERLKADRQKLHDLEADRQAIRTKIADLTLSRTKREGDLANDMSGVQKLLDEKAQIAKDVADAEQLEQTAESSLNLAVSKKAQVESEQEILMKKLEEIRNERKASEAEPAEATCYACKQKLPAEKIKENESKRQNWIAGLMNKGIKLRDAVNVLTKQVEALSDNIKLLTKTHDEVKAELEQAREKANSRLTEIDEAIQNRPTIPPDQDEEWNKITAEITKLESELGEPVEDQLMAIDKERTSAQSELEGINEALAQADRMSHSGLREAA